ncbi:hypothetical protein F5Y09DRAFT_329878 [Xylaria sp. FL1042]|nr:hypothetical protein F5Y09DRAFT_329878 [Xylaria sp. FL1042]
MFTFSRSQAYQALPRIFSEGDRSAKQSTSKQRSSVRFFKIFVFWGAVSLSAAALVVLGRFFGYHEANRLHLYLQKASCHVQQDPIGAVKTTTTPSATPTPSFVRACTDISFRHEWRTLNRKEKANYVAAVSCLARTPSVLRENGTIYDDFPYVHNQFAHLTHGKAAFLSWHRRFIAIYEKYLQEKCGYRGALPYWDWTLDWEDPSSSPIFDPMTGFGGDGDPQGAETVGGGRCVLDGPFSDLRPLYYGGRENPHCFSRGFSDFHGRNASPAMIQQIMASDDYTTFYLAVENGPHNVAPLGIKGDFDSFTAPYDPIFFLHHAQLDRLWFHWQLRMPGVRFKEYSGKGESRPASLDDTLPMGGLGRDIRVSDIMSTQTGGLCYRYYSLS